MTHPRSTPLQQARPSTEVAYYQIHSTADAPESSERSAELITIDGQMTIYVEAPESLPEELIQSIQRSHNDAYLRRVWAGVPDHLMDLGGKEVAAFLRLLDTPSTTSANRLIDVEKLSLLIKRAATAAGGFEVISRAYRELHGISAEQSALVSIVDQTANLMCYINEHHELIGQIVNSPSLAGL